MPHGSIHEIDGHLCIHHVIRKRVLLTLSLIALARAKGIAAFLPQNHSGASCWMDAQQLVTPLAGNRQPTEVPQGIGTSYSNAVTAAAASSPACNAPWM